jgi:hypothetical protein
MLGFKNISIADAATKQATASNVLETLPVIIALLRLDHRVVWVNHACRGSLGENVGKLCYASQFGRDKPFEATCIGALFIHSACIRS